LQKYEEVITKIVIGKGKKKYVDTYTLSPNEKPSNVLGCWVINHNFTSERVSEDVVVRGSYDINVWYSHNDNTETKSISKRFNYQESIKIKYNDKETIGDDINVYVRVITEPNALNCQVEGNEIITELEKEFGADLVSECKVRVRTEDMVENWPEDEEIDNIDTDYLSK